jgi:Phage integrase family/Astacin (Peptidase family M12A)
MNVSFDIVDGHAIVEGDIDLGQAEALMLLSDRTSQANASLFYGRWPNGRIRYLPPGFNQAAINAAIARLEAETDIDFVPVTNPTFGQDMLMFVESNDVNVSSSFVGRQGGWQTVKIWPTHGTSIVMHELLHAAGLWASLAALGGMSAGEVDRLTWPMVDLQKLRIRVPGTKRETRLRTIPIAPALLHRLQAVPAGRRTGRVAGAWGNVRRDLRAAVRRANAAAAAAAEQAGAAPPDPIPFVSPNDLRRTFASWLVQQGAPLLTVATLMGHSSTRMVEKVYGKLSAKNMDDAIALLPAFGTVTTVSAQRPGSGANGHLPDQTEIDGSER